MQRSSGEQTSARIGSSESRSTSASACSRPRSSRSTPSERPASTCAVFDVERPCRSRITVMSPPPPRCPAGPSPPHRAQPGTRRTSTCCGAPRTAAATRSRRDRPTNAIATATSNCAPVALMPSLTGWNASGSENSPDANTAGIASRKPKRAASSRSRPRNRPALIVAPDRDTPGTSARHWARPTVTASGQRSCSACRVWRPTYSAAAITAENTTSAIATTHRFRDARCGSRP